jgi:lysophospholipase
MLMKKSQLVLKMGALLAFLLMVNISMVYAKFQSSEEEQFLKMADGTHLRYRFSAGVADQEVFVVIHGLNENLDMYDDLTDFFRKKGIAIFRYDVKGHGKSEGIKCHIDSFDEHDHHLEEIVGKLHADGFRKVSLVGHSTGGLIILNFLGKRPSQASNGIDHVILSSPYLGLGGNFFSVKVLGPLAILFNLVPILRTTPAPNLSSNSFESNTNTRSRELFDKFNDLSLGIKKYRCGKPTWGWIAASVVLQKKLIAKLDRLDNPILVFEAGKDTVVDNQRVEKFFNSVKKNNAKNELIYSPDSLHSHFHEINREKYFEDVYQFLKKN